jgi:hypothetical protein
MPSAGDREDSATERYRQYQVLQASAKYFFGKGAKVR